MNDFKPLSLERIQAEQDKHKYVSNKTFDVTPVKSISNEQLRGIDTFMDKLIEGISHETDLYIICEMAKDYLHEHREAEWEFREFDEETGIRRSRFCSNCGVPVSQVYRKYCGNCGAKMKGGEGDDKL